MVRRGFCTPTFTADEAAPARSQTPRRLPPINRQWDADRVYRQAVILVTFSDTDFAMDNPQQVYDSIFNAPGYNQRAGEGSVADYFRSQSGGLFNIAFDIYGPIKVSSKAQPYDNPNANTRNYGRDVLREATQKAIDSLAVDFTPYDWNGNGSVNQVIFVYAGYSGNQSSTKCYGHIWPNTSSFSTVKTGTVSIANYTASAELWSNGASCGIGTICHEFSHSLGLPDIYPVNGWTYTAVDEWDLMDGGNFTNYGWCPPNYSAHEKMLMGWLTPVELTEPLTITGMKPVADGGEVYLIRNTENEFYLLENRQWKGWDLGLPGKGLVVFHVNYNANSWTNNAVNNTANKLNYHLIAADEMSYDDWDNQLISSGATSTYQNKPYMNNWHFSGAPYPLLTDAGVEKRELTDTSSPAAVVYNTNVYGEYVMSKPITEIALDGEQVSFKFMGGTDTLAYISDATLNNSGTTMLYDLLGRKQQAGRRSTLLIERTADGRVRKVIK